MVGGEPGMELILKFSGSRVLQARRIRLVGEGGGGDGLGGVRVVGEGSRVWNEF